MNNSLNIQQVLSNLNNLKSGDLLLFHGQHYWFSDLIEIATWSQFSHCGLVLKHNGRAYLFESGLEYDSQIKKSKLCVQITSLDLVLASYNGQVYVRQLTGTENLDQQLYDLYLQLKGISYDTNPFHFLRAYFKLDIGQTRATDEFFCSALVAYLYNQIGLLNSDIDWDMFTPKDIANLKVKSPAVLSELRFIKPYPESFLFKC